MLLETCLLALSLVLATLVANHLNKEEHLQNVSQKPFDWYIGSLAFFRDPFNFLDDAMRSAQNGSMFSFRVLDKTVVMLRGIPGRDAFYSKGLDFMAGYRLLNPQLVDIMPEGEYTGDESWASFMATFIRTEVLEDKFHKMIYDLAGIMETWGDEGIADPFENIYEMVFTLSTRLTTCNEFVDSPEKIKKLRKIFERMEAGSSPSAVILPWFPTPARIGRLLAGKDLYMMIDEVVRARQRENRHEDDPLQVLIDKKFSMATTVRIVAMMLFASVTNTGGVTCWLLLYLEANPAWKNRVQDEIDQFVRSQCSQAVHFPGDCVGVSIAEVPITTLEQETPTLDIVLQETLRLLLDGAFMRRNMGDELFVGKTRVKPGAFLMYHTGDLHLNPDIYPEPREFDPERWLPEAAEQRQLQHGLSFLGWGAARHVCVGKKAATLMIRMITVMVMATHKVTILDASGNRLSKVPRSKNDRLFKVCRPSESVSMKYERRNIFANSTNT